MRAVNSKKTKTASAKKVSSGSHPDHSHSKIRINRIKGQLDGISRMIDERHYCLEIMQQVRAATNALKAVEKVILKAHLEGCVRSAMVSNDPQETAKKVDEIVKLWN